MPTPQEQLVELLREVHRGFGRNIKEVVEQRGLSVSNVVITREINNSPGITVSELSRRTGLAKSHVSNNIKQLEQRGWVEKMPDHSDQRVLRLYLTESAVKELRSIRHDIRKKLQGLVSSIPEERAIALIQGLREIKRALEQAGRNDESGKDRHIKQK